MDWSAWISKSKLHPSLAYEYGLLLSNNELEEDDIKHLDHEFLLSMGISVGKHRLEILKLAMKERSKATSVGKKIRMNATNIIQMLFRSSSSAVMAVPKEVRRRWRARKAAGSRRLLTAKQGRLMITNGNPLVNNYNKEKRGGNVEMKWDSMFHDLKLT